MRRSTRRLAIGVAAITAVACTEGTGPSDPTGLRADLTAMQAVFAAPVVRSVGLFFLVPPFPAPPPGGPLFPDSLLGKTLAWSCATQRYVIADTAGAPATGVRVLLYQLRADGGLVCPTTQIGQLDLVDVSTAETRAVRVSAIPFVDYTLSRLLADSQGASSASGFVGDGDERLTFQRSEDFNSTTHRSAAATQLDDSARDFHAELQDSAQMGVDTYTDRLDLQLRRPDQTLELQGAAGWFNTYRSWNELATLDGAPFATVSGEMVPEGGHPRVTPAAGGILTDAQRRLVLAAVDAPETLRSGFTRVMAIARRLVGL